MAEDYWYFSDIQSVPLRATATKESSVNSYIPTNTRLHILEKGTEWSKIKTEFGDQGWVRNEVITNERPLLRKYKGIEDQALKFEKKNSELLKKKDEQNNEIKSLKEEMAKSEAALKKFQQEYDELVAASGNILQIKNDYKKATLQLNDYFIKNGELEKAVHNQYLYWFLAGAAVLLIGVWLGRSLRKTGHYSSNLRF